MNLKTETNEELKFSLRPMSQTEFLDWHEESIVSYAAEKVAAGNWIEEESLKYARDAFASLLPAGLNTDHNYLYSMILSDQPKPVGTIWISYKPLGTHSAFIFDIVVNEGFRGRGLSKLALQSAERYMAEKGAKSIGLHVFAHNQVARRLYETSGYEITNLNMRKKLAP